MSHLCLNVLVVEDVESRKEIIEEQLNGHKVDWAQNADPAIDLLTRNEYDLVFLDFDLKSSKAEKITRTWMRQKDKFKTQNPFVIIHSMNMQGATKMQLQLSGISKKTIRIPFIQFAKKEIDLNDLLRSQI